MRKVIVINGYGGVGKDTFIEKCANYCTIKNVSSVDIIKKVARILGWDGSKDEASRKFLADLKQLSVNYNDFPSKNLQNETKDFLSLGEVDLLFLHIREPEEITKIKTAFPEVVTLLVINENVKQPTNNADLNVFDYEYDEIIDNSGTLDDLNIIAFNCVKDWLLNE